MAGFDIHPTPQTGRLNSILGIMTVIAGAHGGTKAATGWLDYKKMRDCNLTPDLMGSEDKPKSLKNKK
jgi:hypothetical protein